MQTTFRSKQASYIPGDKRQTLTRAAMDASGKTWPTGTVFVALSGGYDNQLGCKELVVFIKGERVVFHPR